LIAGGAVLRSSDGAIDALRERMAAVYGVDGRCVLPVRGLAHGFEIVLRWAAQRGETATAREPNPALRQLMRLYALRAGDDGAAVGAVFASAREAGDALAQAKKGDAARIFVIDESEIEFAPFESAAEAAAKTDHVVVIRSLECAYGLAGAPCGALIANPDLIAALSLLLEPTALPPIICNAALAVLDPTRRAATLDRIERVKADRKRLAQALSGAPMIIEAAEDAGAAVIVRTADAGEALRALAAWDVAGDRLSDGLIRLSVGAGEENDRLLRAFGVEGTQRPSRRGEIVRETAETRIVASVDLDRAGTASISTGVGFLDHMFLQIVHHAGISATLDCRGDLDVDAHHSIEDCAIAFGDALAGALGERRGIARFGFVLPMDEAEARVSVDLGGRPYLQFNGAFSAPLIGDYPTEMTEHVFRSLAQSLRAAIHLSVTGENDHHKTEACFKAFGRALRQALRVESDLTPSTKGAIL